MPIEKVNALKSLVDWFDKSSEIKKRYAIVVVSVVLLITQGSIYDTKITTINADNVIRCDSINYNHARLLENCNSESKENLQKIIRVLQTSLKQREEERIESEKMRMESERLKIESEHLNLLLNKNKRLTKNK